MSNLREAAQQALKALEAMQSYAASERKGLRICDEAILALRAALAQQDGPEPVAWMCPEDPERETAFNWKAGRCENCGKQCIPLYAALEKEQAEPKRHFVTGDEFLVTGNEFYGAPPAPYATWGEAMATMLDAGVIEGLRISALEQAPGIGEEE